MTRDDTHGNQQLCIKIMDKLSDTQLTRSEKQIIKEEIKAGSNMTIMIFKFYLQSGELDFFVRRLKNVAAPRSNFD